jgi:hypothetical protein
VTAGGFELRTDLEIARPASDVFAVMADTRTFRALDPALVEVEPEGPLSSGLSGRFPHRRGGFAARTTWRVTDFTSPRRLVVEIQGSGYAMTEDVTLEERSGSTRARFVERVWPTSLAGRVLLALSGSIMRRDLAKRAALLKSTLEQSEAG